MIQPDELQDEHAVALPGGGAAPANRIWEMLTASAAGNLNRVQELELQYPGLALAEYNYTPPLHFAVINGYAEVVRYLLQEGASLNYRSYPFGDTYLTFALDRGHDEVAGILQQQLENQFPLSLEVSPLLEAAKDGDLSAIASILSLRPELLHVTNDFGESALHVAVEAGQVEVAAALLDSGASPDSPRSDGARPITLALRLANRDPKASERLADLLLKNGAEYSIYIAAARGDFHFVKAALVRDASLANFRDSSHTYPLTIAARRNDFDMVKLLLLHGADPSLPEDGAPLGQPLWVAVYQRQHEMARILLEHGANPNTAPESSGSALFQARGDQYLTSLLLEHGAVDNSDDMNPLIDAIRENRLQEVEAMLSDPSYIQGQDAMFWNQGILAGPAHDKQIEMIELLMRHGARVPAVSQWGRFYYFEHTRAAEVLLRNGMDPNHMTWRHVTLLHDMAHAGDLEKAKLLLDYGADINAIDEEYCSTPLGFAVRWGNTDMAQMLLESGADPTLSGASWSKPLVWAQKKGHHSLQILLPKYGAK